jgi:hypothetical protein
MDLVLPLELDATLWVAHSLFPPGEARNYFVRIASTISKAPMEKFTFHTKKYNLLNFSLNFRVQC